MKKYFLKAVLPAITLTVIDFLIDRNHTLADYAIEAIIIIIVLGLAAYLDDKGWNSWERVISLVKRKKTDE